MTKLLHIALVSETWAPEVNGVAMSMGRLVAGLRELGHHVSVVRPRQGREPEGTDLLVPALPLPGYPGLQMGVPCAGRLRQHWQASRPDVVHLVTEGPLGWAALRAARALGLPCTSSYHTHFDGYSRHYGARLLEPLVRLWLRRFHRATRFTLAPTEALARHLGAAGIPGARPLGRGVDTQLFSPARRSPLLRQQWGAAEGDLVVLSVGRLAPEKNPGLAARAFEALREQQPGARMVWVGDGPALAGLQRAHPSHHFAGMRHGEDLATHYASADLFLFPSLTETYGNVLPEAMASGLAVVAFAEAAAAELVENAHNGLAVPPGNSEQFIAAAIELARNPPRCRTLGQAARQRVQPLSWARCAQRFEETLTEAATGSPPPGNPA